MNETLPARNQLSQLPNPDAVERVQNSLPTITAETAGVIALVDQGDGIHKGGIGFGREASTGEIGSGVGDLSWSGKVASDRIMYAYGHNNNPVSVNHEDDRLALLSKDEARSAAIHALLEGHENQCVTKPTIKIDRDSSRMTAAQAAERDASGKGDPTASLGTVFYRDQFDTSVHAIEVGSVYETGVDGRPTEMTAFNVSRRPASREEYDDVVRQINQRELVAGGFIKAV